MKKLLLTMLLLLSLGIGFSASASEVEELKVSNFGTTFAYAKNPTYSSASSGLSYKIGAYSQSGNFQQNKSKGCFFEVTENKNNVIITKIELIIVDSYTAKTEYFSAAASDAHLPVTIAKAGDGTGSISGGTTVTYNNGFSPNSKFFSYVITSSAKSFQFSSIKVTYETAPTTQEIELVDENVEVKIGDEVITEDEIEIPVGTEITWSYKTDVENAELTYGYQVDDEEAVTGTNKFTYDGTAAMVDFFVKSGENTASKMIIINRQYPTECPAPIFSVEDGAELYAGQTVTVKAYGAESVVLKADGVEVADGKYTVEGEIGATVTLTAIASVTGKDGPITNEKTITINIIAKTESVFIFNGDGAKTYGMTPTSDANEDETVNKIQEGIVKINLSGTYRLWDSDKTLRIMDGGKFTVSVPDDYYLTSITFTGTGSNNALSANIGSFSNGTWTAGDLEESSITFTRIAKLYLKTITVKYAKRVTAILGMDYKANLDGDNKVMTFTYFVHVKNHLNDNTYHLVVDIDGDVKELELEAPKAVEPQMGGPLRKGTHDVSGTNEGATHVIEGTKSIDFSSEVGNQHKLNVAVKLNGEVAHQANEVVYTVTTGIEDVSVDAEAAPEYYNLQGIRVANPEAGRIYIERRGTRATKIRF